MRYGLKLIQWMPKLQRILATKGLRGLSAPCMHYFKRNRRHLLGGITILCIFAVLAPLTILSSTKRRTNLSAAELPEYETWQHNFAQTAQIDSMPNQYGICTLTPPQHPSHPMNPVLAASFPDGSPDLMRFLIEGTTGLLTGSGTFTNDVAAVKTHYPYYENHASVSKSKANDPETKIAPTRAIIVLRDPLDSMESWMGWVLNTVHETDQTLRASKENWIKWKNRHFRAEIKEWELFLRYWLDTVPITSRYIVGYEDLLQETTGPTELTEMVQFIRSVADIPKDVSLQSLPCLWRKITGVHFVDNEQLPSQLDDRPYSFEDLDLTAGILTNLIDDYKDQSKVLSKLQQYKERVMEKMRQLQQREPVMISNEKGTCMVTSPINERMTPVFLASYPGSGSGMLRDLIEAMTGIKTGESKRQNNVVAVKTSYPANQQDAHPGFLNRDMKRTILLIRNPLNAIFSYHNHIFWQENDLLQHSLRAPQEAWEQWRDKNFLNEVDKWIDHLHYWFNTIDTNQLMILNYEWLIHDGRGPRQGTRVSMFIDGTDGEQTSAPAATVPCLWYRSVKVINPTAITDDHPTFTTQQLESAAAKLSVVGREYTYDLLLGPVLKSYFEHAVMQIQGQQGQNTEEIS